jgi:hypothetical protein
MLNNNLFLTITIVLLIIYIYYIQFYRIVKPKIFNDELIKSKLLKTGDMCCFKAYDNFNSPFIFSYFGHCGIVYIDPQDETQTPMLFEANGIEKVPLKPHHNTRGVFLTPLEDRVKKYKGRVFWKPLNKELPDDVINDFKHFTEYALDNMYYNYNVVSSGAKKGLGLEKCHLGTNCGEIIFLSLIKLQLLPLDAYEKNMFHHLRFVCNLQELSNGYRYLDMIEIIEHPFKE